MLGVDPLKHLLSSEHVLSSLPVAAQHTLTGHSYFPSLIAQPFHAGLVAAFSMSIALSLIAAAASYLRS